jgi:hypothetical protein
MPITDNQNVVSYGQLQNMRNAVDVIPNILKSLEIKKGISS